MVKEMGVLFAIAAAICNSSIGIFSNILYRSNMVSINIAFYRCAIALVITSILCLSNKKLRQDLFKISLKTVSQYAVLSFLGIFIMYYFEISSMKYIIVPLVSFLLYSSGILTIVLSCIFLKEQFNLKKLISIVLVFMGVALLFLSNVKAESNVMGLVLASVAGLAYALFLFFMKMFKIESGLKTLFYLFLFGTIYLAIPFIFTQPDVPAAKNIFPLIALAVIPTICGFYFTVKALNKTDAGKVQLFEMTEPLFATILSFIILGQVITKIDLLSAIFIFVGLLFLENDTIIEIIKDKLSLIRNYSNRKSYKRKDICNDN